MPMAQCRIDEKWTSPGRSVSFLLLGRYQYPKRIETFAHGARHGPQATQATLVAHQSPEMVKQTMDFGLTSLRLLDSYHVQSLLAMLGPHLHRAWTNLVIFNPSWFTLKEAFCRISPASIDIMGIRYHLEE